MPLNPKQGTTILTYVALPSSCRSHFCGFATSIGADVRVVDCASGSRRLFPYSSSTTGRESTSRWLTREDSLVASTVMRGAVEKILRPRGHQHHHALPQTSPRCFSMNHFLKVMSIGRGCVRSPCRGFVTFTSVGLQQHTPHLETADGEAPHEGPERKGGEPKTSTSASQESTDTTTRQKPGATAMERAAEARREIFDLWTKVGEWETEYMEKVQKEPISIRREKAAAAEEEEGERRYKALTHLLDRYDMRLTTPLEEDVCRGLGDAFDRLVLMCVPIPSGLPSSKAAARRSGTRGLDQGATEQQEEGENKTEKRNPEEMENDITRRLETSPTQLLERVLQLASRQGRRLTVRVVQHLFARTRRYTEALAVFHALRRTHFAMSMETYHAMLYSLQRLEEEGWSERFREELIENSLQADKPGVAKGSNGVSTNCGVSEQAMEFILRGVQHPLLPENKPWLGRIMYGNGAGGEEDEVAERGDSFSTAAAATKQTTKSWDALGKLWVQRYKQGHNATPATPTPGFPSA